MAVKVHCDVDRGMTGPFLGDLRMNSGAEQLRCMAVAKVVKSDARLSVNPALPCAPLRKTRRVRHGGPPKYVIDWHSDLQYPRCGKQCGTAFVLCTPQCNHYDKSWTSRNDDEGLRRKPASSLSRCTNVLVCGCCVGQLVSGRRHGNDQFADKMPSRAFDYQPRQGCHQCN
jgi:hypothetical protein